MIKQVTKFETEGGQVFNTEKEAEAYEAEISFIRWYDNHNKLHGNTESVDFEDVVKWLKENKEKVLDFLQKIS
jgi:hypothetical protein